MLEFASTNTSPKWKLASRSETYLNLNLKTSCAVKSMCAHNVQNDGSQKAIFSNKADNNPGQVIRQVQDSEYINIYIWVDCKGRLIVRRKKIVICMTCFHLSWQINISIHL